MKNIVICCDGTWLSRSKKHTDNIGIIAQISDTGDAQQMVYYDAGVGTSGIFFKRLLDGATGRGLSRNICEAYRWLVEHFEDGDLIYLFGYSRGAFTVRSLAGMIRKCGILTPKNKNLVHEAYTLYRDGGRDPYSQAAKTFRNSYSYTWNAYFVGVFDTVGTLGIPLTFLNSYNRRKHQFHDLSLSRRISFGYHAVALDERRYHFRPTLWKSQPSPGQVIEQVWFPGSHSNIGGGWKNTELSNIPLHWMLEKAVSAGLRLNITPDTFQGNPLGPVRHSRHSIYQFYPSCIRPVAQLHNQTERIDDSVYERIIKKPDYLPKNILCPLPNRDTHMPH